MSKVKQNEKVKYLQELGNEWPRMYGEKGQYPDLIDELLAEIPEAAGLADTDEPLYETMGTFDLFENPWRFERNNDDESARPNNTFDEPTPKKKKAITSRHTPIRIAVRRFIYKVLYYSSRYGNSRRRLNSASHPNGSGRTRCDVLFKVRSIKSGHCTKPEASPSDERTT